MALLFGPHVKFARGLEYEVVGVVLQCIRKRAFELERQALCFAHFEPIADVGEGDQADQIVIAIGPLLADVQEQIDLGGRETAMVLSRRHWPACGVPACRRGRQVGQARFDLLADPRLLTLLGLQRQRDTPGAFFDFEYRVKHKKGHWVWVEGTLTNMLHEPAINALASNFRDVSGKKKAQEQEGFDRNNLNALINNTQDLQWRLDRSFRLITFNWPFYDAIKAVTGKKLRKGDDVLQQLYIHNK